MHKVGPKRSLFIRCPLTGGFGPLRDQLNRHPPPSPFPFVVQRGGERGSSVRCSGREMSAPRPCAPAPATTDWHPQGSCSRDHGHRSALWAPCHPPSSPVSPSMNCHESRMPVECHNHRHSSPAPTHPRGSCRLFFLCVGHHLSQPICNSTLAFPSPVQSSPVQPQASPALSCPAPASPAFRPPSPPH